MDHQHEIVLLYVPCASEEEALLICRALLDDRLIACANIVASRSVFFWEGQLNDATEQLLICKTIRSRASAAEHLVRELHSYKVPCILRLAPEQVNLDYAHWVVGEVTMPRKTDSAVAP